MKKNKEAKMNINHKRYIFIFGFVLLFSVLILSCVWYLKSNECGTFVIRGKVANDIPIEYDTTTKHMLVPLIPVLQKLDYSINQQYGSIIISSKEGQQYELNLEDLTLYKSGGKSINCLKCPPGSYGAVCVNKGNDVILDTVTLHSTLFLMDSEYKVISIPQYKLVIIY